MVDTYAEATEQKANWAPDKDGETVQHTGPSWANWARLLTGSKSYLLRHGLPDNSGIAKLSSPRNHPSRTVRTYGSQPFVRGFSKLWAKSTGKLKKINGKLVFRLVFHGESGRRGDFQRCVLENTHWTKFGRPPMKNATASPKQ